MKRHYELFYSKRGLESIEEFFPELVGEENDVVKLENDNTFEENYFAADKESYEISFSIQSMIEPDYYYTALKYFREGKDFSFLIWQDFYQSFLNGSYQKDFVLGFHLVKMVSQILKLFIIRKVSVP